MKKGTGVLWSVFAVLSLLAAVSCAPAEKPASSYAEDRAQIEDLQARYMFALDFGDLDTYVSTFTEDGVLDIIGWQAKGRAEIKERLGASRPAAETEQGNADPGPYPATGRHNITNIVVKIDGDKAEGRAYWFHYGNNNPERKAQLDSYGYYVDEMTRVDGQWLFSKRVIYNEQMADWIGSRENPAW
jgi:3-phenylpropionate/cinnamic acid dioxygenase small subunit